MPNQKNTRHATSQKRQVQGLLADASVLMAGMSRVYFSAPTIGDLGTGPGPLRIPACTIRLCCYGVMRRSSKIAPPLSDTLWLVCAMPTYTLSPMKTVALPIDRHVSPSVEISAENELPVRVMRIQAGAVPLAFAADALCPSVVARY